jgi:hypothetical protein
MPLWRIQRGELWLVDFGLFGQGTLVGFKLAGEGSQPQPRWERNMEPKQPFRIII